MSNNIGVKHVEIMYKNEQLRNIMDNLYLSYPYKDRRNEDPIKFIHNYDTPKEQEIAGFLSSCLAYGKVSLFLPKISFIFESMNNEAGSLQNFINNFDDNDNNWIKGFAYRFTRGEHLASLFTSIKRIYLEYGGLHNSFLSCYQDDAPTIEHALISWVDIIRKFYPKNSYCNGKLDPRLSFLLPSPKEKSACKRLNLFFRWMVRKQDEMDIGIWNDVSTSKLIFPLDTHTYRLCFDLGITKRKQADWKTAIDVTNVLKSWDPVDPVKYDFAICHLGMTKRSIESITEDQS